MTEKMTLAEWLGLPDGWVAEEYSSTMEFRGPCGERAGIPKPYDPVPRSQWQAQAAVAVREATKAK
jgi:hypothetical protein